MNQFSKSRQDFASKSESRGFSSANKILSSDERLIKITQDWISEFIKRDKFVTQRVYEQETADVSF